MKTLIVLSGGMDSATALAWSLDQGHEAVGAVNFQYGSKQNAREKHSVEKIVSHYNLPLYEIPLEFMNRLFKSDLLQSGGAIPDGHYNEASMQKTVVPFRNGIMLSIAAGLAESLEAEAIVLGNHYGDHATYADCRKSFIEPMREAIREGTDAQIELLSPFCDIDKAEIARIGTRLNVPYSLTYTCYKGAEQHCGSCGSCTARKEAFKLAGVADPTEYLA